MKLTFIVNPRAGRGSMERKLDKVLRASGLEYAIRLTERPKHAVELARAAAAESDVVVAVGGDGTVHEVASGLIAAGGKAGLAIIAAGTGNDFGKMFDVPADLASAVRAISTSPLTKVDHGRIWWSGSDGGGSAVFMNVAGAGIDAKVAAAASGFKLLTGTPRYVAAVLATLKDWTAPPVEVELWDAGRLIETIRSEILLVGAGNGRCAAGGFYLTPDASITDGKLDALVVRSASVLRILALIPSVLRGKHVGQPEVTIEKVDKIVVRPSTQVAIEADGEVMTHVAEEITFEVVAGGLSVRMPVKT
ncbi:MAG: diacylglycerol kinase family protein [Rhodothermales bacterium]